jgi:hypothetical protein
MRLAIIAFLLAGCGPDEEPATFTRVQSEVFSISCVASVCHTGSAPAEMMNLTGDAYDDIVDVPSVQAPDKVRVKPGDPDGSYLLDKLLGKQMIGDQMPVGVPLEEERIDLVRRWIAAGALDD